jgi:hypothetical protein
VGVTGALVAAESTCTMLAFGQFRLVGGRDLLHMMTRLVPSKAQGPEPFCTTQVFSPTESPRLQWVVTVAQGGEGKMRTARKRPDELRPPNSEEAARLAAVLTSAKSAPSAGLMVPIVIREPNGWIVYLMRHANKPDAVAMGPHYRMFVSADGATITNKEVLSEDDEVVSLTIEGGKRLDAMKFPFNKPVPNEAHSFISAITGLPLLITTELGTWTVNKHKIELIEPAP